MTGTYKYLSLKDRRQIEKLHRSGARALDIAMRLGVHTATVYHELSRGYTGELDNNQRQDYSADLAQRRVQENFRNRGKKRKPNGEAAEQ